LAFPWWEAVVTLLAETSTSPALSHVPGHGVLSRQGELVLLCDAAPERESQIAALLDALSSVAADRGDGRDLGRRLAGLLAAAPGDEFPALCAFGPAGDGMAVLLHGAAEATAVGPDGETRLDGRQAVIFVDRTLAGPVTSLRAMVGESSGALAPDRWSRLDSGVVRAQALVYGADTVGPPAQPESVAPALAEPSDPLERLMPAEPSAPPGQPMLEECSMASGQPMLEECSMPAPPVAEPTAVEARAGDGGSPIEDFDVLGTYCRDGHFNDPRVRYCTACGVSMVHLTHTLRPGRRPALGVLTLDDGMTFPLEGTTSWVATRTRTSWSPRAVRVRWRSTTQRAWCPACTRESSWTAGTSRSWTPGPRTAPTCAATRTTNGGGFHRTWLSPSRPVPG
jgi:hypothetical protein